jgi:hypothetical protein
MSTKQAQPRNMGLCRPRRRFRTLLSGIVLGAFLAGLFAAPSSAAAPNFKVNLLAPDFVTAGKAMRIDVSVLNLRSAPLNGDMTVTYDLPPGIQTLGTPIESSSKLQEFECSISGQLVECTGDASGLESGAEMVLQSKELTVEPSATGTLTGSVEVSGSALAGETFLKPFTVTVGPSGPFAINALEVEPEDPSGFPASQAGAVPTELATAIRLRSEARLNFDVPEPNFVLTVPPESLRDVLTHVPRGLIANPSATALRCQAAQLASPIYYTSTPQCPLESQVGVFRLDGSSLGPLWNVVPPPGYPAAFGFYFEGTVTYLLPRVRPSDNGIDIVVEKAVSSVPLPETEITFWGVPADPSHNHLRGVCLQGTNGYEPAFGEVCNSFAANRTAFLRNPTSCPETALPWGGSAPEPLHWGVEIDTFQHPGVFVTKHTTSPAIEGCELLPFDPEVSLDTSEHTAHTASGLDFSLTIPQNTDPDGLAESDLRAATLTLPQGVTLNPAAAEGLGACSDAQLRLGLEGPSQCPESSKLGSLELTTPLLEEPIGGDVFLRSQASQDPASGDLYRIAIELRSDQRGVDIKLPGRLVVDPDTGQLTTAFADLPQLPFETLNLHLKNGSRGPLTTPPACGSYAAHAVLEGWSGKTVSLDPSFAIDQGCAPATFAPGFEAGVADNTAGHYSPLTLRITRGSGQPNLSRIDTTLPEGELAKFAGVALCPEAAMQSGECPAASRIGTVIAGLGEGTAPLFLPQPGKSTPALYVGGPYQGAPYSVLAKVPAQAGPFDLGTVAVRSRVEVDPETTQARIVSDPLPQIYGGIPVTYRDVRVDVDRPSFAINPTDCEPMATTGVLASIAGDSAQVSRRFQVSDCALLGFKPKLSLALRGAVHRRAHPKLIATLKARPGDANIAKAQVKLPRAAFLDNAHIGTVCTRPDFAAHSCPADSVYGRASATSPLLDYPLYGYVYLRSNPAHKLPDLVVDLRGAQTTPIEVALAGKTDSVKGALRNTFELVPDAPVSTFHLELFGGKRGLIELSSGFCAHPNATVKLDGQNGRIYDTTPRVSADCGGHRGAGGGY